MEILISILENEAVWKCACGNEEVIPLVWKKAEPWRQGRWLAVEQVPKRLPEQFEHSEIEKDDDYFYGFIPAIKCHKCGIKDEGFRIDGKLQCELWEKSNKQNKNKVKNLLKSSPTVHTVYAGFPHAVFRCF